MPFRLPDRWMWDFWFAQDGPDYHLFYLQADRSLAEESLRHWHVSIGHAVSQDLRRWQTLPDALCPDAANPDAFDSHATWTGSIIRHQGRWHLLYTGGKKSEQGLVQRVGLATSDDLLVWQRHPDNPVITADPQWYEQLDLSAWHDQAWRDPWVFRHPQTGQFHALITARVPHGPADARGVIGHARSDDLIRWQVLPPVTEPGEFGHLEVPQVAAIGGRYYLLFSVPHMHYSTRRKARLGERCATGTHYLMADDPLGPYSPPPESDILSGDAGGSLYSGKLIQDRDGAWVFMAFHNFSPAGEFIGEISDPMPVSVRADGRLLVSG